MTARQLCTIVVRALGLWLTLTWLPTIWWRVVSLVEYFATGSVQQLGPSASTFWTTAGWAGELLVFLAGAWMLIDGKELINHFQYVTGRCGRCGYDLMKVAGDKCPECGMEVPERQRRRIASTEP